MAVQAEPKDPSLHACRKRYAENASPQDSKWKAFRQSPCGQKWFKALADAYGGRCCYCDHAPARTIDHRTAKRARSGACEVYDWQNWLPACGDCNRLKGTKPVVDPVRVDPRRHVVFDVATGRPVSKGGRRALGCTTVTRLHLDNQVLNDARRRAVQRAVAAMAEAVETDSPRPLQRLLNRRTPHLAVVRDLVIEGDAQRESYRIIVQAAVKRFPGLLDWANEPTADLRLA